MEQKRAMIIQSLFFGAFFFIGLNVFQMLFREEVRMLQNAVAAGIGFIVYLLFSWWGIRKKKK